MTDGCPQLNFSEMEPNESKRIFEALFHTISNGVHDKEPQVKINAILLLQSLMKHHCRNFEKLSSSTHSERFRNIIIGIMKQLLKLIGIEEAVYQDGQLRQSTSRNPVMTSQLAARNALRNISGYPLTSFRYQIEFVISDPSPDT